MYARCNHGRDEETHQRWKCLHQNTDSSGVDGKCTGPLTPGLSAKNQMKKMVLELIKQWGTKISKIWIGTLFHRPDREVELEGSLWKMNSAFAGAVKDLRNHAHEKKRVEFLVVHKLFLERFCYVDILTGHEACHLWIIKPTSTHFVAGSRDLNPVGLYHLKSYILQVVGVLQQVNTWTGIPE